ncbi:hypothetical protein PA14OR_4830 [Pseudomonas aeruginosa]|nr:hypothetical protein RL076 [Pseudomonas aeruginosa PA14]ABJ13852.1 hypothetical protein PA14_59370 [Pseudomonas aeruginosa UCBPP-PA14]EKA40365.1 hypothetical protein PACI27_4932 [Pseudomonas aeruginosa CI27]SCM64708.1 hypothetical protein PA14OR_4830 [Pseudomonas aeruginosa]
MVFLLQVEGAEKTLALAGKWIPRWVAEGSFYRPRPTDRATRSYAVLGWINTVGCAAAFRIRAAWGHVADNVSRSRVHHRSGGRKCQGQAGGGADAAGGERGRKSAAGRNPVKGFPSRVWKGSQVSHLWLNRRSLGIDRLDPITRPLSWLGQQTVGTHPRTKGALRITGGPPAGRRIPMGSLIVLEQEHQATHGEGKRRGRNTSTTLKSRKHRTS